MSWSQRSTLASDSPRLKALSLIRQPLFTKVWAFASYLISVTVRFLVSAFVIYRVRLNIVTSLEMFKDEQKDVHKLPNIMSGSW